MGGPASLAVFDETGMSDDPVLDALEASLGHRFARRELLLDALTHRSFVNERKDLAPRDNERLEYLGDAVLGLAAATLLADRFPDATEGELTRRRADLVCEAGLAGAAESLALGAALRLGRGEERSGGRSKPRLLASAFEACIGAILLDAGVEYACDVARRLLAERLDEASPGASDFKSRIQELLQGRSGRTPRYTLVGTEGPDHDRRFEVALEIDGESLGTGTGRSKVEAEQAAARAALEALERASEASGAES